MLKSHLALLVCALAPLTAHATSVAYQSDDMLFKNADIVMTAKVWRFAEAYDHTNYELEARECFKGCQSGQFVVMTSPGVSQKRPVEGLHEQIDGAPHPQLNDELIIYLIAMPDGRYQPLSLGLSVYTMKFNAALKRYIAHRETDQLFVAKPTSGLPARAAQNQVLELNDKFATDVIASLRKKAKAQ